MRCDRSYQIGPVQITRHYVNWADLGPDFNDLANLTLDRASSITPGSDHFYLNPGFSLKAPGEVAEETFLRQANRACILWNKHVSSILGSGARKRVAKRVPDDVRMLAFSGVLILHGQGVHSKRLNVLARPQVKTPC